MNSKAYFTWVNTLSLVRVLDTRTRAVALDPEKIKPVTLTVPSWAAADMGQKCSACGWPVYVITIGMSEYHYCTSPECKNSPLFESICKGLEHEDRVKNEREERARVRHDEREREAVEDRRLAQVIETHVRRILFSYGVKVRKVKT